MALVEQRVNSSWWREAACKGLDPELFYPIRGQNGTAAKAVCATCPVREPCLQEALDTHDMLGVRGGLSSIERGALLGHKKGTVVARRLDIAK